MELVYRLENVNGKGPFSGNSCISDFIIDHNEPFEIQYRISEEDWNTFEDAMQHGWVFGWESDTLFDKFIRPGYSDAVALKGFSLYVYEVEHFIKFPDGQVVFEKETSRLKFTRSVKDVNCNF